MDAINANKVISDAILEHVKESCSKYEKLLDPWQQDKIHQCMAFEDLGERARKVKPIFDEVLAKLVEEFQMDSQATLKSGGIKGAERGKKKCTVKYAGDSSQMSDMVRGTIVINGTIDDLYAICKKVICSPQMSNRHMHFTLFADRYQRPLGEYRDLLALVRIDGFACELQFNLASVVNVKESKEGHGNYEVERLANDDLLIACVRNDLEAALHAKHRGAKASRLAESKNGLSALHFAAYHGNEALIMTLLEIDANPCCVDYDGHLPLHHAVLNRDERTVQLLIERMDQSKLLLGLNAKSGTAFMECAGIIAEMGSTMASVAPYFASVAEQALEHKEPEVRRAASRALGSFPIIGERLAEMRLNVEAEVEASQIITDLFEREEPQAIVEASIRVKFTWHVERALRAGISFEQQHAFTKMVRRRLVITSRKKWAEADLSVLHSIMNLLAEHKGTLLRLMEAQEAGNVSEVWRDELRCYKTPENRIRVECGGACAMFRQECGRFTNLLTSGETKKCRRRYFEALETGKALLFMGDAGTGKSETLKDIAHALGLDATILNYEILKSSPMQWIQVFTEAKKRGVNTPIILDEAQRVPLEGLQSFITNAKAVGAMPAMTCSTAFVDTLPAEFIEQLVIQKCQKPDYALVMTGHLSMSGFQNADNLGPMLHSLLEQLGHQCSKQPQYDFGMRAVIRLIRRASLLAGATIPDAEDEKKYVGQAVLDHFLPRFSRDDRQVLRSLLVKNFGMQQLSPGWAQGLGKWPGVAACLRQTAQFVTGTLVTPVLPEERPSCLEAMKHEAAQSGANLRVVKGTIVDHSFDELLGTDGTLTNEFRLASAGDTAMWLVIAYGDVTDDNCQKVKEVCTALYTLLDGNSKFCLPTGEIISLQEDDNVIFLAGADIMQHQSILAPAFTSRVGWVCTDVEA
eukprot:gnl/MRDRNA2_/MRDRNA2_98846_c0_seq1.p1 gnl/MRDRNA2_/MRDRNA2_98846_c0~~gnl/MRDRNA2_/MRDRNA2_98846_c0_seq1.p1  ORF type:complete len:1012 (-),score=221.08 gnl/MRDRNA2_/MRDRNA2_98846_c0_seq1:46-2805(-)